VEQTYMLHLKAQVYLSFVHYITTETGLE